MWVDIGDFCGRLSHGQCDQCQYPTGFEAGFEPTSLAVTVLPGEVHADTVMVFGDTGPRCNGLPECECDGWGECFLGVGVDHDWLRATLLDYVLDSGYREVHCRVVVDPFGLAPGTYEARINTFGFGCCCASNCMPVTLHVLSPSAVAGSAAPAAGFWVSPPAPNPTRGSIRFDLRLTESGRVRGTIFDAGGRRVAEILDRTLTAGLSRQSWNPSAELVRMLPSGAYFLRVEAGSEQATRMFLITR
jgi:hypothetical protein